MVNCFLQTLKTDGIMNGLYAGTIPALVANVAENSVLFAAYGGCQKVISNILGKIVFFKIIQKDKLIIMLDLKKISYTFIHSISSIYIHIYISI